MDFKEFLNEGKDLSVYADTLAKMTDNNESMGTRLLCATLTGNKRIVEIVKAINNIVDYEKHNPINEYTNTIYTRIHELGRKKHGEDNWNKFIYSNT